MAERKTQTGPIVGIDLGTTYSVIAYLNPDGNPKTILNEEGDLTTPSAVFFDRDSTIVGREAIKAAQFEAARLATHAKRDIGEAKFHKPVLGDQFPPEVIEALILIKLKRDAELRLGEFTKAVITVPAYFNEPRRKATQDAGRLAGLEVLDIINEPTAAAIAYGFQNGFIDRETSARQRELILVYDLGGGTFDVTLMEIDGKNYNTRATAGDVHLGGIDWDNRIVDHLAQAFQAEHGIDLRTVPEAYEMLLLEAAEAKRSLTARNQAKVQVTHEGKQSRVTLTRDQFEAMTADLLERTRLTVRRVLKDANVTWGDITRLLSVGGSTRMPMVQKMLQNESGKAVDRSLSPDEAVAHGAAIYAGTFFQQENPAQPRVVIQNVNSHDLGVLGLKKESLADQRKIMIHRNTPLPASHVSRFVTARDGQKNISVRVVEGGTDSGEGCNLIGKCLVSDLPKDLPASTAVEVTFQYQADGRLHVNANVPSAGREATMTIQRNSGFTEEQIKEWKQRIDAGLSLPESAFAQVAAPASAESDEEEGFVLVEDEAPAAPQINIQSAASARPVEPIPINITPAKATPAKPKPAKTSPVVKAEPAQVDSDELSFDDLFEGKSSAPKVKSDDSDLNDFLKSLG